jgi:hypothetical protein
MGFTWATVWWVAILPSCTLTPERSTMCNARILRSSQNYSPNSLVPMGDDSAVSLSMLTQCWFICETSDALPTLTEREIMCLVDWSARAYSRDTPSAPLPPYLRALAKHFAALAAASQPACGAPIQRCLPPPDSSRDELMASAQCSLAVPGQGSSPRAVCVHHPTEASVDTNKPGGCEQSSRGECMRSALNSTDDGVRENGADEVGYGTQNAALASDSVPSGVGAREAVALADACGTAAVGNREFDPDAALVNYYWHGEPHLHTHETFRLLWPLGKRQQADCALFHVVALAL